MEDRLAASYGTKRVLSAQPSSHAPWCLPKGVENCPHKNPHTDVDSSFLHIAKTWKQPACPSVGDEATAGHPGMEYYSVLKRMSSDATRSHGGSLNAWC